jgi:hypothetical protein
MDLYEYLLLFKRNDEQISADPGPVTKEIFPYPKNFVFLRLLYKQINKNSIIFVYNTENVMKREAAGGGRIVLRFACSGDKDGYIEQTKCNSLKASIYSINKMPSWLNLN